MPPKPVLLKTVDYHATITRACSFGLTACAHLLFRVHTNYVITLSRTGTGIEGAEYGLGLPGDAREKVSLACGSWVCGQGAPAETWWRWMLEQGEKEPVICLFLRNGIHSFFPSSFGDWGLISLRGCPLCNLKVFKRAIRQALSHSAGNPKEDRQAKSGKGGPATSYFAEGEVRQRE